MEQVIGYILPVINLVVLVLGSTLVTVTYLSYSTASDTVKTIVDLTLMLFTFLMIFRLFGV